MLGDDGEQVLAFQPLDDLVRLRRLADRVGAEDEQALDGRIEPHLADERLTEPQVVDDARAGLDEVGTGGLHPVDGEIPQRKLQHAAADVAPRAGERRDGVDGARRLGAAGRPLDGDADADGGGLAGRELARELDDVRRLHAGDLLDILGRELLGALLQLREAADVLVDVVLVDETLLDHRIDDAHGKRAVGAGSRADVPVTGLGGARLVGVDDHDLGAALLRLEHERPVMQVGRDRVARPDDDVLAVHEALGVDAARRSVRQQPCRRGARRAVGLLVHRRAEAIEERIPRVDALHEAHVAEIALRHDRLRAVLGDDVAPATADLGDRFFPGNAFEVVAAVGARTLGADAAQRVHQAIGIVMMVVEVLELHAQRSARDRMLLVPLHIDELAVIHLVDHRARIRAVVRTGAEEGFGGVELLVHWCPPGRLPGAEASRWASIAAGAAV